MKGFSHFMSGVAVASFCPWSIDAALQGNPLFFVLGGACGILPDTLDFKVYRFFYKHDIYITPDPGNPDPQYIADEMARAMDLAITDGLQSAMLWGAAGGGETRQIVVPRRPDV